MTKPVRRVGLGRHLRQDAGYNFGRVRTATRGISAAVIIDRLLAGETERELAEDYDAPLVEIHAVRAWLDRLVAREDCR